MRFGADCGVLHRDEALYRSLIARLVETGVTDLTGSNMPGRKEEKILEVGVQIQGDRSGSCSSGLQDFAVSVFWTETKVSRPQFLHL